jgi:hypothetical protein
LLEYVSCCEQQTVPNSMFLFILCRCGGYEVLNVVYVLFSGFNSAVQSIMETRYIVSVTYLFIVVCVLIKTLINDTDKIIVAYS